MTKGGKKLESVKRIENESGEEKNEGVKKMKKLPGGQLFHFFIVNTKKLIKLKNNLSFLALIGNYSFGTNEHNSPH